MNADKQLKILLVEDNPADALLLRENIFLSGSEDISVSTVASLQQAVEYCQANLPDVALLDLTLPDSAGIETVRRARQFCSEIPIVVLTGVDDEQIGVEAVRLGVQDYLVKGQADGRSIVRAIRYAIERKRLEQQILLANERLQFLLTETSAVIYTSAISGNYGNTFTSENVIRLTGYKASDFTDNADFWLEHIHPDDKKQVLDGLPHVFKKLYYVHEYRFLCSNGKYIWLHDEMRIVRDSRGKPLEIIGCMIDITERKQAEQEREQLLAQLRAVIDSMDEGLLITDNAGNLLEMNPKARKIHEYATNEQVAQHIKTFNDKFEFLTLEGQPLPQDQWPLPRVLRGEAFSEFEVRVHRKDTGKIWTGLYGGTPVRDKTGKVTLAVLTLRDITKFKQMEEELRQSRDRLEIKVRERTAELADALVTLQDQMEEREKIQSALIESELKYRELVENANSIILRRNADGTITFFNEFAQKFFGFSEREIIGRNIFDTITPRIDSSGRDMQALVADITKNPEKYQNLDAENMCRDGRRVWVGWTVRPIKDEFGKVVEILSVGNDITYRKQAEAKIQEYDSQLRSLTTELVLAEEEERRNVAEALHDSIGPLLAFSERELGNIQKFVTKEVSMSLDEVKHHIGDTIKLTRSLTFDLSPSTLYDLGFETAIEELAEQFGRERKLKFAFKNSDEPKPLTDEAKILLYRSIRELFVNIAKHADAKTVSVALAAMDENIRITIKDDGKGFDTSKLDAKASKSRGFGLFSIRERLTHIGGNFSIESRKGKGTKVTLLAPLDLQKK